MKNKNKKFLFDFGLYPCNDANETGSSGNGVHASRSILYALMGITCFGLILVAIVLASLTKRECASQASIGYVEVTSPLVHAENQFSVMASMRYTQIPTQVVKAALSHDGRLLATHDYKTNLWEVATGRCLQSYTHSGGCDDAIALSSDGKYFACAEYSNIRIWDTTSGKRIIDIPLSKFQKLKPGMPGYNFTYGKSNLINHMCRDAKLDFSPDGKTLAVFIQGETYSVFLLSIPDGHRKALLSAEAKERLEDVRFSPNGRCLLVMGSYLPIIKGKIQGYHGRLTCWDCMTWKRQWQQDTGSNDIITPVSAFGYERQWQHETCYVPEAMAFSPDGNTMVISKVEAGVRSMKDGGLIDKFEQFYDHRPRLLPLAFSPDGSHLVMTDCNDVRIYAMADLHTPVRVLPIQYALCARYSADGKELLTLNREGYLERWNVETGLCTNHILVDAERHVEPVPWVVKSAQNGD